MSYGNNEQDAIRRTYEAHAREESRQQAIKIQKDRESGIIGQRRPQFDSKSNVIYESSKRSRASKILDWVGWSVLCLALVMLFFKVENPVILGLVFWKFLFATAACCLVTVHFSVLVVISAVVYSAWLIWCKGQTAGGFEFGAVSMEAWGTIAFILVIGFLLSKIFGK